MITKKLRTFVPRPNNFVIVNCETITLLTRGLSPAGQKPRERATDDHPRDFLRMQREFSSAQAKSDHLDDEMSCRMVREVCWWCACRASGGVHLVCAWCSACVCRQVHISSSRWSFLVPGTDFGAISRAFWSWEAPGTLGGGFLVVLVGIFDHFRRKSVKMTDFQWILVVDPPLCG